MIYVKGKWIKYSNKILPRYVRKHFEVKVNEKKNVAFYSWERALIYEEFLNLRRDLKEGSRKNG